MQSAKRKRPNYLYFASVRGVKEQGVIVCWVCFFIFLSSQSVVVFTLLKKVLLLYPQPHLPMRLWPYLQLRSHIHIDIELTCCKLCMSQLGQCNVNHEGVVDKLGTQGVVEPLATYTYLNRILRPHVYVMEFAMKGIWARQHGLSGVGWRTGWDIQC